jgi:hypothetical protein
VDDGSNLNVTNRREIFGGSCPRAKAWVEDRFAAKGRERPCQGVAKARNMKRDITGFPDPNPYCSSRTNTKEHLSCP